MVKGNSDIPKNNFAMELMCLVEADSCTGYFAKLKRELDGKCR